MVPGLGPLARSQPHPTSTQPSAQEPPGPSLRSPWMATAHLCPISHSVAILSQGQKGFQGHTGNARAGTLPPNQHNTFTPPPSPPPGSFWNRLYLPGVSQQTIGGSACCPLRGTQ